MPINHPKAPRAHKANRVLQQPSVESLIYWAKTIGRFSRVLVRLAAPPGQFPKIPESILESYVHFESIRLQEEVTGLKYITSQTKSCDFGVTQTAAWKQRLEKAKEFRQYYEFVKIALEQNDPVYFHKALDSTDGQTRILGVYLI